MYLESTSQAVHAVVGLLRWQALEGELDNLVLLGDQIIGSAECRMLARPSMALQYCRNINATCPHALAV
jgi:hypothetical protein